MPLELSLLHGHWLLWHAWSYEVVSAIELPSVVHTVSLLNGVFSLL